MFPAGVRSPGVHIVCRTELSDATKPIIKLDLTSFVKGWLMDIDIVPVKLFITETYTNISFSSISNTRISKLIIN